MRVTSSLRTAALGFFTILATASCSSGGADEQLVGSESEITGRVATDATLVTTQRAYLRSEAKKDPDNILKTLKEGARLTPELSKPKKGWYKVRTKDDTVGWVLGRYLEVEDSDVDLEFDDEEDPVEEDEDSSDLESTGSSSARTVGGTFSKSPTVKFGGGDHCNFEETLSSGVVSIEVDASGEVTHGKVTAKSTEKILDGCTKSPLIAPQNQEWRFMKQTGDELIFWPAEGNTPPSNLVITGDLTQLPASITLKWHRYDFGPPLDWTINMTMRVSGN